MPKKKLLLGIIIASILLAFGILITQSMIQFNLNRKVKLTNPKGTPFQVVDQTQVRLNRTQEKRKYPADYTIVLVGDSMIETMGNFDELKAALADHFPGKTFQLLNYGFGSTNILSVQQRMESPTQRDREFMAINDIVYDIIILESFGHNPLSDYSLQEGLKKQTTALDQVRQTIKQVSPSAKLVFLATLAPNKYSYAKGTVELNQAQRELWVQERMSYIQNHIAYAKNHALPLINVYEESLNEAGTGDSSFINKTDNIHPSSQGIKLISQEIATFLKQEKIIPE